MYCSACQVSFNTLSKYVKHCHDLHSHSKKFRLICSCGGSFSTLRSLQNHWYRLHNEEETRTEEDRIADQNTIDHDDSINPQNEEAENIDETNILENESSINTNETDDLNEEQLKTFEKRVLYTLLTLQTAFYTSEAAIEYAADTDLQRVIPDYDPNRIGDTHDGVFAQDHPNFKKSNYLKIEINFYGLTITNPISHRAHSIFFFYWSLLNVSKEKRSKQSAKRLIAVCLKWARKYNSLCHTVYDFLIGMNTLATTGITININGAYETYYGGLFISLGDYPAQISLNGFKESVSATHFYHLCDIEHDHLEVDITHDFASITVTQYRERCIGLELIQGYSKSYENLSKRFGINCRSLFDGLYDVTRQCPYDTIRTLLERRWSFHVLRANSISNKIPTNLFNMIVARLSYGKSDLTRLLRDMLQTVVLHRPTKFCSTSQVAVGIQANPSLDEMSKAGLMSGLDECCRIMICDEADITFSDVGLFLSHNGCRASPEMNCRALVMTLFDRVSHAYIRQLANRSVSVKCSKLNIMGCSTGDLISNMIIRMKSGACFDPAIGRFIFWPLDGPVIPDKLVHRQIDNHLFPSLHQFGIILSFIENVVFSFEDDGINEMILWGNKCKQRSFDERNTNESLSARLGKSVQHVYRMATFLQTIEIGFSISQEYIERYQQFPAIGVIDTDFIDNVSDLLFSKYPAQFRLHEPDPFQISKDIALRAIDLISCNIRQFIMLFDSTYAPKVPSIGRQVVIISSNEQKRFSGDQSLIQNKELNLKQHQRSMSNLNNVAAAVILFPSLCFTMKQLHRSTIIHNNSGGGVLKQVMKKLVDTDVLAICPRGVKHASRTTCVYIKKLPLENDVDGEKEFLSILSEYTYKEKPISIDMYRQSCKSIVLEAIGTVQEEVFQLLGRPEYGTRDLNMLVNLPKTNKSNIDCSNNHTLIQTIENSALHQDDERENIVAMSSSYSNQSSLCSSDILLQEEENLFDNLNFIDQPQNENVDCISVHHEEKHNSFNTIDFPNAEENINLNSINIFQEKHLNDLNNVDFLDVQEPINFNNADMFPEEQHDDLHSMDCPDTGEIVDLINISISPEEQRNDINSNDFLDGEANINLNNIDIVPEKQCSHLNNGNAAHSENNSNLNNVNIYHNDQSNCSDNFFSSPAAERTRSKSKMNRMTNQKIALNNKSYENNNNNKTKRKFESQCSTRKTASNKRIRK
ncbi:unnamed protein product [Rotaria magnacalcarata]